MRHTGPGWHSLGRRLTAVATGRDAAPLISVCTLTPPRWLIELNFSAFLSHDFRSLSNPDVHCSIFLPAYLHLPNLYWCCMSSRIPIIVVS